MFGGALGEATSSLGPARRSAHRAGPEGLVEVDSPMDFASTSITTFLGFLGLENLTLVAAGQLDADPKAALNAARNAARRTAARP